MPEPVITVENVSKRYLVGHRAERSYGHGLTELREVVSREAQRTARKAIDVIRGRQVVQGDSIEEFWALKDVSFEVRQGEVLGIIGRNGAGKSTVLKILSRITEPTMGRITLRGRVASLLEVGTGFHPELTGRENIYLNGAILGMTRAEIRKKFDEIVAFAQTERFLDTPVKRYSSGMYVRLAFAVAAHLEPEILIVDEVLSVGDAEFQKKCLGKMDEVSRREGRTVLFVSHNLQAVRRLCSSTVLLTSGRVEAYGPTFDCLRQYTSKLTEAAMTHYQRPLSKPEAEWCIQEAWIEQAGDVTTKVSRDEPITIVIVARGSAAGGVAAECILRDHHQYPIVFCASGHILHAEIKMTPGIYAIRLTLHIPLLAIGRYYLDIMLAESGKRFFDAVESAIYFDIDSRLPSGWEFRQDRGQGAITLDANDFRLEWARISPNSLQLVEKGQSVAGQISEIIFENDTAALTVPER
jgi:lipopolysaccharide transport system ATP-binding protein